MKKITTIIANSVKCPHVKKLEPGYFHIIHINYNDFTKITDLIRKTIVWYLTYILS